MDDFSDELTTIQLQQVKEDFEDRLDSWSIKTFGENSKPRRTHLGISEIGDPCRRKLWYGFRWMTPKGSNDGRIERLYQFGHDSEHRYVRYLRATGWTVIQYANQDEIDASSFDPTVASSVVPKQISVTGIMGHYGGSTDGVGISPLFPNVKFVLEMKTHNTKSFTHYISHGLQKSKPKHWDQMCSYGWKQDIKYGLYFPENKNDSDIKVTAVKLDFNRAMELEKKAESIILSQEAPEGVSKNPAYFDCTYCSARPVCHYGQVPPKNCRSCKNSKPTENATWTCSKFGVIPSEFIQKGCDQWQPM